MFCAKCGSAVAPQAPFCPVCGAPQEVSSGMGMPGPMAMARPVIRLDKADGMRWLGQGWEIVKADIGLFAVHALLFLVVSGAIPLILQGPMILGMQYAIMRRMMVGRTEVGDVFKGFNYFLPAMVAGILVSLFGSIGFALCLVPGLFVLAALQFPFLLIVDKGMDFWPAIETSFEAAKRDWVGYIVFVLLQGLVVTAGVLACCVGVLVALPVIHAATVVAYQDVFGFEQRTVDQAR
jgi:hypothetical protein